MLSDCLSIGGRGGDGDPKVGKSGFDSSEILPGYCTRVEEMFLLVDPVNAFWGIGIISSIFVFW